MGETFPQPDPGHRHGPRCEKLQALLQDCVEVAGNSWAIDRIKCRLEQLIGYSIAGQEGRVALACRVADAHNLMDLARALGRPLYEVRHYYAVLRHLLAKEGGLAGLESAIELHRRLQDWVTRTGYPDLPLKGETYQSVAVFFKDLQAKYTWKKLYDADRPTLPLLLPPDILAKNITGCKSKQELSVELSVGVSRLDALNETLAQGRPQRYRLYHNIALLADELGYTDIEVEREEPHSAILHSNNNLGKAKQSQSEGKAIQTGRNGAQHANKEISDPAKPLTLALDDKTCDLYRFLSEAVEAERRGLSSIYRESVEEKLGGSLLDMHTRMEFSSQVANAHNMTELADVLRMTTPNMLELYQNLGESIGEFFDGTSGINELTEITERLHNFLKDTGYPHVPLSNSAEYVKTFFVDLQSAFDKKYLKHFQSAVLPLTEEPDYLANTLAGCQSATELQEKLKCTEFEMNWSKRHLADIFEKYSLEFRLLSRGVNLARDLGLDDPGAAT